MSKREKIVEPAQISYFFGPGYQNLWEIIKQAWKNNSETVDDLKISRRVKVDDGGILLVPMWLFYTCAVLAMRIFGSIFFLGIGVLHCVILITFMIWMYILFGIVWGIDRFILWRTKVSHVCTNCHKKYLFPIYCCSCGRQHKRLAPGKYGILTRVCDCGMKLPTSGFKKVNGVSRRELPAICPVCGHEDKQGDSVQIVVPIGGGRSSGKSVFINAFVYDFIQNLSVLKEFEVDPLKNAYNEKMERQYKDIKQYYEHGMTMRTEKAMSRTESSAKDFSFWVNHKNFSVPKLIHILDIDGESFVQNEENEVQLQYRHCSGTLLVIDPFWITQFRNRVIEKLDSEDKNGITNDPKQLVDVLDAFKTKVRGVLQLKGSQRISIPMAVGIAKIDSGGLEDVIGERAIKKKMTDEPENYTNYHDTMDVLCREFLKDNGEESFLTNLDTEFSNVRFFAFSALGHPLRRGRYSPRGVMEIMEWIIGQGDADMKKIWNNHNF